MVSAIPFNLFLLRTPDPSGIQASSFLSRFVSSQSHFTRQFKHFTGRTPGDYRDRIRT